MNKFEAIRKEIESICVTALTEKGYEVLTVGSQEYSIPVVNSDGDEGYINIPFKVPKGSRDGEAYDGYEMAEDYKLKVKVKEEKAEAAAKKKAEKIAKDKKAREEKAAKKNW